MRPCSLKTKIGVEAYTASALPGDYLPRENSFLWAICPSSSNSPYPFSCKQSQLISVDHKHTGKGEGKRGSVKMEGVNSGG